MSAARVLLFVYGTLKRGGANHDWLAGQEFAGPARTAPRYRLVDCGDHPGLVADPTHGVAVAGELWRVDVDALDRLDVLEGAPDLFARGAVELADGIDTAVAYFFTRGSGGLRDCGDNWPPGGGG